MPKVTVVLIRHGETEAEALKVQEDTAMAEYEKDLEEYNVAVAAKGDNDEEEEQLKPPSKPKIKKLALSQRLDPMLSEKGHFQSGATMKHLLTTLVEQDRRVAFFSAPLRSCTSTAMMMSVAGVSHAVAEQGTLRWGLTTVDTNLPPAAIPVVIQNGLCNDTIEIKKMGGDTAVINGGLLHCAAETWNDGRSKAPFQSVIQGMKDISQKSTRAWVEGKNEVAFDSDYDSDDSDYAVEHAQKLAEGKKIAIAELRRCDMTQFLRIKDPQDPWSLEEMTPKVSLVVDRLEPPMYKTPPRRGNFEPSKQDQTWKKGVSGP